MNLLLTKYVIGDGWTNPVNECTIFDIGICEYPVELEVAPASDFPVPNSSAVELTVEEYSACVTALT